MCTKTGITFSSRHSHTQQRLEIPVKLYNK